MTADDDRLPPSVLDSYQVPAPSADLSERFAARLAARPPRGRRWMIGIVAVAVAAAAVVVAIAWPGRPAAQAEAGSTAATRRTTIALGARGVAVAEPGAHLAWRVAGDGEAALDQDAGDVFYRVEHGGSFVVGTPVGELSVRGTCFRADLATTTSGASLALTVYEGTVEVANRHGRLAASAGDRVAMTLATAPHFAPTRVAEQPAPDATVSDLIARDRAHRDRIAALEAQLARTQVSEPLRPFEMSPVQLAELAKQCSVPIDQPPIAGSTLVDQRTEEGLRDAGFSEAERAAVERVTARLQPAYETELRALYRELTGEDAALDPVTLIVEIAQKSAPADVARAHQIVAAERAGLRPPPADPRAGSVMERYLRRALAAADAFERALAAEIGLDRAHTFRRTWGAVNLEPGCPAKAPP